MFFKGSRYAEVGEAQIVDSQGREIRYKTVRFIPETPPRMGHIVGESERLDHIAHHYFQDSERFWRICDANGVMSPEEVVAEPGRKIVIPASEG